MNWKTLAEKILASGSVSQQEALAILESPDDELLALLDAAFAVRRRYFGRGVALHVIQNAQSGLCSEDCAFCSQSASAKASIERYPLQSIEEIVKGAHDAYRLNALRYCVVISGRAPPAKTVERICAAVRRIKQEVPLQICTSLGLLDENQARQLKQAGVNRYNHNLETSERFFDSICTTHKYADRLATARTVKAAGMELCSGGLLGMGETLQDRIDLAFALQALALFAANSMFTNGYLTTPGQGYAADVAMIAAAGFQVTSVTQA
jgi:biotin synthase